MPSYEHPHEAGAAAESADIDTARICAPDNYGVDPKTSDFYRKTIITANESMVPFLVGGSYAFNSFTGIGRKTKDFDIFVHPRDVEHIMKVFADAGYSTEITAPHWLGKVFSGDDFVDIIFGSGKGINDIDDEWFKHAVEKKILGIPVRLCPPEEIIWSKSFIMERERYDGADIAHLFHACAEGLDWKRLLHRFGPHWRLLFSHLILFGFIYPSDRARIPEWVTAELLSRLEDEMKSRPPAERVCRGTLLSRDQYLVDIACRGYSDARPDTASAAGDHT